MPHINTSLLVMMLMYSASIAEREKTRFSDTSESIYDDLLMEYRKCGLEGLYYDEHGVLYERIVSYDPRSFRVHAVDRAVYSHLLDYYWGLTIFKDINTFEMLYTVKGCYDASAKKLVKEAERMCANVGVSVFDCSDASAEVFELEYRRKITIDDSDTVSMVLHRIKECSDQLIMIHYTARRQTIGK